MNCRFPTKPESAQNAGAEAARLK